MRSIELLAPAKDFTCGQTAIDCGADAVYIGGPRFGARENAGNSLEDIATLTAYAHRYWANVYVTLNTLLYDQELAEAVRWIWALHEIGVDGVIIQDMGLLECELPPIPLIASTQMHNDTPAKVRFLQDIGLRRAILARELSLEEIQAIHQAAPEMELECFIHGALCVCYSGQCYMSYALGGRSANRGQCAQPCRKPYTLLDPAGSVLENERHWLSIKDLNQTASLGALLDAGVSSFKIEGRLKNQAYVANVVAHYRTELDRLLPDFGFRKSSSGSCQTPFQPNPEKTFNRGYTSYFLHGRQQPIGSLDTPKMTGEALGRVTAMQGRRIRLDSAASMRPGDGICFFDAQGELRGSQIVAVDGPLVSLDKPEGLTKGMAVFRNFDHAFHKTLTNQRPQRCIRVHLTVSETTEGLCLAARDEDGVFVKEKMLGSFEPARQPDRALEAVQKQVARCGDTEFQCENVDVVWTQALFLPLSTLNTIRRAVLDRLREARLRNHPRPTQPFQPSAVPYPSRELQFCGNVLNQKAKAFYQRHGVTVIEPAAESGLHMEGRLLMTTKYCIKHQLQACPRDHPAITLPDRLYLADREGHRFALRFDCQRCVMEIYADKI